MRVIDQMQREVNFTFPPQRIVSLVPSQSEFLVSIGVGSRLVGVTKFCIHPADLKQKAQIIGGTKQFHLQKVLALEPDLVIGNMEENSREQIELLSQSVPVYMSKVESVPDAYDMMIALGHCCGLSEAASNLVQQIKLAWEHLTPLKPQRRVAYLIWKDPWMAAGPNTYVDDVLNRLGFLNVFDCTSSSRYPQTSLEMLSGLKPEEILLSSEPYPFKEADKAILEQQVADAMIHLVDGEMFSWYGSRMLFAVSYFNKLLADLQK